MCQSSSYRKPDCVLTGGSNPCRQPRSGVCLPAKLHPSLSVPIEEACNGGMMYPYITHISHEVGFQFLDLILLLIQHTSDIAEAVNPGIKQVLKQYVGYLSFPHNLAPQKGGVGIGLGV
eukprot:5378672-Ditylum_brightwellii.AAC.1